VEVDTERDLAEAHAFVRRRLVRALVSGADGGGDVGRGRSVRAAVGGVAIASLLMAVAAVSGVLARHPETDGSTSGTSIRATTAAVPDPYRGRIRDWRRIGDSNP
jgi:hypothetical protein